MVIAGILAGCLILASGCKKQNVAPQGQKPEVGFIKVGAEQVVTTTELPGRPWAFRVAEIRPQVSGIIQKRLFTEGSDVNAGQVLYQIDPAPFQASFNNASAALAKAEAGLVAISSRVERYKELLIDNAVSKQDYDDALASMKQAEADIQYSKAIVDTARINLERTRVTAPISGRIGKSSVTDGALVAAYQPLALATIQQLDPIYVDLPQSTSEMLRLKRTFEEGRLSEAGKDQDKVILIMEDGRKYPQEGTLQFRDITVDPTTGSVTLRAVFPNPEGALLPGMFVRVIVKEGVHDNAILIPQQTVSRDVKGNPVAMIIDSEEKVQQRTLTLDRAIGNKWLVTSGLEAGERVIIEGMQKVRPGTHVKAVPFADQEKLEAKPETQKPGEVNDAV